MIQKRILSSVVILLGLLFSHRSFAFFSVMDTGDALEKGQIRATFEPQFVFTRSTGANLVGRVQSYIAEDMDAEALIGFGSSIDFMAGGFIKWSPIPDVDKQPAIAGKLGLVYDRYGGEPEVSIRFYPIVSKKFDTKYGFFTPYGSVPLALETRKGKATGTAHIAAGTQYQTLNWKNVQFMSEIGLDLKDSYSYLSLGLLIYFDEEKGFSVN